MIKFSKLPTLEKASLILAGALLVCLLPLPYGFYSIVRLATAIIAGCWAYKFYSAHKNSLAVIAGAIALLFQPFLKISLDQASWNMLDFILAVIIIIFITRKHK